MYFQCLKESYVKAIGVGIGFSLQRLDFCPQSDPELNHVLSDTKVCVDDVLQKNWRFEETMLDDTHSVAVALQQVCFKKKKLTGCEDYIQGLGVIK